MRIPRELMLSLYRTGSFPLPNTCNMLIFYLSLLASSGHDEKYRKPGLAEQTLDCRSPELTLHICTSLVIRRPLIWARYLKGGELAELIT